MKETKNFKWFEFGCRFFVWIGGTALGVKTFWDKIHPLSPYDACTYIYMLFLVILFIAIFVVGFSNLNERARYLSKQS